MLKNFIWRFKSHSKRVLRSFYSKFIHPLHKPISYRIHRSLTHEVLNEVRLVRTELNKDMDLLRGQLQDDQSAILDGLNISLNNVKLDLDSSMNIAVSDILQELLFLREELKKIKNEK